MEKLENGNHFGCAEGAACADFGFDNFAEDAVKAPFHAVCIIHIYMCTKESLSASRQSHAS